MTKINLLKTIIENKIIMRFDHSSVGDVYIACIEV